MPIHHELAPLILTVVAQIPYGKVASYGQIARLAGLPKHARLVGYVLKHLDANSDLPWHRVVNSKGEIRSQSIESGLNRQGQLLLEEGVMVSHLRVDLKRYLWQI